MSPNRRAPPRHHAIAGSVLLHDVYVVYVVYVVLLARAGGGGGHVSAQRTVEAERAELATLLHLRKGREARKNRAGDRRERAAGSWQRAAVRRNKRTIVCIKAKAKSIVFHLGSVTESSMSWLSQLYVLRTPSMMPAGASFVNLIEHWSTAQQHDASNKRAERSTHARE